jgi:hypothetical protein
MEPDTIQGTNDLIVIPGLEGNQPVTPTPLQQILMPYVPFIEIFWWGVWLGTFVYVVTKYIAKPLLEK